MRKQLCFSLLAVCLLAVPAVAEHHEGEAAQPEEAQPEAPQFTPEQIAMMEAWQQAMQPGEPHELLAKRAGEFAMTVKMWMDPTAEAMTSEGTVKRSMILGGRVLEEKVRSNMMGQPFEGIGRVGYDNITGKYWNTWIDSMSTGCFMSHGERDAETGVMTFRGEFEDPATGSKTMVRAVVHPEAEGKEVFEWYEDRGEGEHRTMEITYVRTS